MKNTELKQHMSKYNLSNRALIGISAKLGNKIDSTTLSRQLKGNITISKGYSLFYTLLFTVYFPAKDGCWL